MLEYLRESPNRDRYWACQTAEALDSLALGLP